MAQALARKLALAADRLEQGHSARIGERFRHQLELPGGEGMRGCGLHRDDLMIIKLRRIVKIPCGSPFLPLAGGDTLKREPPKALRFSAVGTRHTLQGVAYPSSSDPLAGSCSPGTARTAVGSTTGGSPAALR